MNRVRAFVLALLVGAAVVVAVTLQVPDTRVPVVSSTDGSRAELARALEDGAKQLRQDPSLSLEELAAEHPVIVDTSGPEPAGLAWAMVGVAVAALGAVVVGRGNGWGRWLLGVGAVSVLFGLARAVADLAVHDGSSSTVVAQVAFALADTSWIPLGVVLVPNLLLRLPNGELPSPRWRWVPRLAVVAAACLLVQLGDPRRYDGRALATHDGLPQQLVDVLFAPGIFAWTFVLVVSAASVVVRFRRAVGGERAQLEWVAWGVGTSVALLLLSEVALRLGGDPAVWGPVGATGFFVLLPGSILLAVLRHRLFDIDVVVNRTFVFALLSLSIAVVYVGAIALAGAALGLGATPAALGAMVLVALAFEPLRLRVVALVERVVWRRGTDARAAVAQALTSVATQREADEVLGAILGAAASATNAAEVALLVRDGNDVRSLAAVGEVEGPVALDRCELAIPVGPDAMLAVRMQPGDRVRAHEREAVEAVAALCALAMDHDRLRAELDRLVGQLDRRRADLVEAQDRLGAVITQARASVERDLHDGAQARAVSLATRVGLARATSDARPDDLLAAIAAAEDAVRSFAHGLHPEVLGQRGLAVVIREDAEALLPHADVHVDVGAVPASVAAVAHLVASEAMVNAARHAPGADVAVTCRTEAGALEIDVENGPGTGAATAVVDSRAGGSGLASLLERVEALGGTLRLEVSDDGARLHATLPIPTPAAGTPAASAPVAATP